MNKRLANIKTPHGRSVEEIVQSVNQQGDNVEQVQELIYTMEYLVERLTFADAHRFLN